jgi:hypothetical protein
MNIASPQIRTAHRADSQRANRKVVPKPAIRAGGEPGTFEPQRCSLAVPVALVWSSASKWAKNPYPGWRLIDDCSIPQHPRIGGGCRVRFHAAIAAGRG